MAQRKTKAVAVRPKPVLIVDNSGMQQVMQAIVSAAANPRFSVEKMEHLIRLRNSMEDRAAKIAFDNALADMQPHMPQIDRRGRIIIRKKDVKTGERTGPIEQSTGYARWEDIDDIIRPILHKYGFSLTFRTGTAPDGKLTVTGILARGGHREETTLPLQYDSTGSKNPNQAAGSTTSYGKRYTACLLLNIVTRGEDDDGMSYKPKHMVSQEQLAELIRLADEAGADKARFCAMLKVDSFADIPALRYEEAKAQLERKIKRKAKAAEADFPGDKPMKPEPDFVLKRGATTPPKNEYFR